MPNQSYSPGLAGVVAGETSLSCVTSEQLLYRGYPIQELAGAVRYEEVAHLLIYGELPTRRQLSLLHDTLMEYRRLPRQVLEILRTIPTDIGLMDVLRTTVSIAGHYDPTDEVSLDGRRRRAIWLLATVASLIAARYRFASRQPIVDPKPGLSHAGQILYQCHGQEPDPSAEKLLDLTLVLYAENDFNASTFTARIIASTGSDLVSAVVGAIGALKGPQHGGANARAMEMLARFASPQEAEAFARRALAEKERLPGFGHRVYRAGDHRAVILEQALRQSADLKDAARWMAIYDALATPLIEERGLYPNVDLPAGLAYHLLGLPPDMYTPLFVASRSAGWCAHFLEQVQQNKLFRPLSQYVGEPLRRVPPIETR